MSLNVGVVAAVVVAGALHATWNTLVKAGDDRTAMLVLVMVGGGVAWSPVAALLPLPEAASWPFLCASALIHLVYAASLLAAYRHGDLSQVYPIARGSAPALVAIGAWLLAGEVLTSIEGVAVGVVSVGILSLAWRQGGLQADSRSVRFALLTGITIASYIVVDGMGVRRAGTPLAYVAWLFLAEGASLACIGIWLRRSRLRPTLRANWLPGLCGGVIASASYGIAVWAMSRGAMAHVTALRETSVLVAAVIGTRILGEPFGARRIAAAAMVAAGAVALQLAAPG